MADINASIPLGYQPIQIQDPVNQFAKQQELAVNALKMQEYQQGVQEKNALARRVSTPGFNPLDPQHQADLYREAPSLAPGYIEKALTTQESTSKLVDSRLKQSRQLLDGITTPEEYIAWHEANHRDPVLGPLLASRGVTADQSRARIMNSLTQPGGLDRLIQESKLGVEKFAEMNKPVAVGPRSTLVSPMTGKEIFRNTAAETSEIPKLRPGEKWNAGQQRVDLVPGSELYNKTAPKHTKDYAAANAVEDKSDWAIKKIDTILDPKNKDGFESNFGGYNAYATRLKTGNTAKIRNEIESLKSDLKSAGLDQIRKGGSIGAITEREWPILQNMIANITPDLSEADARIKLNEVKAKFQAIKADAKDNYDTTWGQTQFHKTRSGGTPPAGGGGGAGVDTNNPLLK